MRNQSVIYSLLLELIIAPTFENRDVNYYCRYWITRFEVCLLMVSIQKCNCIQKQRCRERGGPGGQRPLEFGRSVNSIQTRGAGYAPHTTASPPRFKKLSTPLLSWLSYLSCRFQSLCLQRLSKKFDLAEMVFQNLSLDVLAYMATSGGHFSRPLGMGGFWS